MTDRRPPDVDALLRHGASIRQLAVRLCADVHGVDDAMQDTWVAALQAPPRHDGNPRGWLAALLRNSVRLRRRRDERRQRREETAVPALADEAAVDAAARAELHRHLVALVLQLPEPQRGLVLLHYFEGREIAALAGDRGLSADAVRAHLRRARDVLRQQLECVPLHRRTLRGLVLVPVGTPASLIAAGQTAVLSTGAVAAGSVLAMKTKITLGAAALAALAVLWLAVAPPNALRTEASAPGGGAPAVALSPSNAADSTADNGQQAPAPRTQLESAAPVVLRVHLRGIDARAPWTTTLRVNLEGYDAPAQTWLDHTDRIAPDAGGLVHATLPEWGLRAERLRLRLTGDDPNYIEFDERTDGPLPESREVTIDVQVVAVLTGRVVDERGNGVPASRIAVFPVVAGEVQDGVLGQTNSAADGSFVLQAPPDVNLHLVAAAMREASLSGMRMISRHGAISDVGEFAAELLPAAQRAAGRVGVAAALPDIVLRRAPVVAGTVRWSSGQPVAKASVELRPRGGRRLTFSDGIQVRQVGALLAPRARRQCDADGAFRLPAPAGVQVDAVVADVEGHKLFGAFSRLLPTAPAMVDLELPLPIEVVAEHEGQRRRANLEIEGHGASGMDDGGALRLVTAMPLRVRARSDRLRSGWVGVGLDDGGRSVVLAMHEVLAEVAVEFEGGFRVRNAHFRWEPLTGGEAGIAARYRDDRGDPFQLFLEPGRYRLAIEPSFGGERNGNFLLPATMEIDVGLAGQRITVPAVFGGTFALLVTDARGMYVAGRCRVRDAAGRDLTDRFRLRARGSRGEPGELMAGAPNEFTRILPVGDYELELDLGAQGVVRRTVRVEAREIVEVRVRLP